MSTSDTVMAYDPGTDVGAVSTALAAAYRKRGFERVASEIERYLRDQQRWYWSGPTAQERRILIRHYRIDPQHLGLAPRSVLRTMHRRKR